MRMLKSSRLFDAIVTAIALALIGWFVVMTLLWASGHQKSNKPNDGLQNSRIDAPFIPVEAAVGVYDR